MRIFRLSPHQRASALQRICATAWARTTQRREVGGHPTRVVLAAASVAARAEGADQTRHSPRPSAEPLSVAAREAVMIIKRKNVAWLFSPLENGANASSLDDDGVLIQVEIHKQRPPMQPIISEPCCLRDGTRFIEASWLTPAGHHYACVVSEEVGNALRWAAA